MQPIWRTVQTFLKKLNIELLYEPTIALQGIYCKDKDVVKRMAICTPMFIAAMANIPQEAR